MHQNNSFLELKGDFPPNLVLLLALVDDDTSLALRPVREAVNDRGLFTAGWFGVREKHCSQLEIYDRL